MRFTDEKLYVLGIGEAYMVEPGTGNILYWTNKMREANVSFSATDNVLSAGIGNGPAIIIPTDPNITVNVTAADYSEYVKAASVGGVIAPGAPVLTCQQVKADGPTLAISTASGTPVAGAGMDKIVCYVQEVGAASPVSLGRIAYELDPQTGEVIGFTAVSGRDYLVTYHVAQANATMTTVTGNLKGKIVLFAFSQPIYTNYDAQTQAGDFYGWLHTVIPRLQLLPGGGSSTGSQTDFTMTGITGRAITADPLVVTEDCGGCGYMGAPMAYRIVEPCEKPGGIEYIIGVVGGKLNLTKGEEVQISPLVVANGEIISSIPPDQFVYSSSDPSTAEIGRTSGLLKAVEDGDVQIAVFYTDPETGKTFTDIFEVEIEPFPTWKFTCLKGVNLHMTGKNLTVDYGDGTIETVADDTNTHLRHVYSNSVRSYQVTISGVIRELQFYKSGEDALATSYYLQTVDTPFPRNQITNFSECFSYCRSLAAIPSGLFDNCTAVTSFSACFSSCTKIKAIPSGLFDNCTAVTNFAWVFNNCASLTAIPSGLFDNCTAVTTFSYCFRLCTNLTAIPNGLFDSCTAVTSFDHCFGNCTSLTAIPNGLFDNCTAVTGFGACFSGCTSLTAIPGALFDNCTAVTDFALCFENCTSLAVIPSGLFDNCTAVTSFRNCFYNCTSLTAIPSGLFDNCTAVTSFNSCFLSCASLAAIPSGLFDNCTKVTTFHSCFNKCASLTVIPSGLFDNCTAVTSFSGCFRLCTNLTAIPSGLFDNCTAVTTFDDCFHDCPKIISIPDELFDNCAAVTGFGACFSGCTSLTAIPGALFDNCTAVTGFGACFYGCTSITAIPSGLFDNCTKVTTFSYCFQACAGITSEVPPLWDTTRWPNVTSYSKCFYGCTSAANYSSIPSGWK